MIWGKDGIYGVGEQVRDFIDEMETILLSLEVKYS